MHSALKRSNATLPPSLRHHPASNASSRSQTHGKGKSNTIVAVGSASNSASGSHSGTNPNRPRSNSNQNVIGGWGRVPRPPSAASTSIVKVKAQVSPSPRQARKLTDSGKDSRDKVYGRGGVVEISPYSRLNPNGKFTHALPECFKHIADTFDIPYFRIKQAGEHAEVDVAQVVKAVRGFLPPALRGEGMATAVGSDSKKGAANVRAMPEQEDAKEAQGQDEDKDKNQAKVQDANGVFEKLDG